MSEPIVVAIIGTLGTIIGALITAYVNRWRNRRDEASKLDQVLAELSPNSGKSVKDAVDRIDITLAAHGKQLKGHGERLARVETHVEYLRGRD